MITPQIEAKRLQRALNILRETNVDVIKDLRAELRTQINPIAKKTAQGVPIRPPISGMGNTSPTGWTAVGSLVSVTPFRSSKQGNTLVSVRISPRGNRRGLFIGELAGSRSGGTQARGRRLIDVLNSRYPMKGKGGRFAYDAFRKLRPEAIEIARGIVNKTIRKIDKKLKI